MLFAFVLLGYVLMVMGAIWLIICCFQENVVWGVCSIFFPGITWLLFLLIHPSECWKPTSTYLAGIGLICLPFILLSVNPELSVKEESANSEMSVNQSYFLDLDPYKIVHKGVTPVIIKRVAIRVDSKVRYLDIEFHDYFIEKGNKLFAIDLDGNKGLLNAKRIEKDLCDKTTISQIRSFASICLRR